MGTYVGIPILMLAAVLQSTWLENLHILGGRPDLVLLIVVTWAIIRGANAGALWGFIGGICCDLLSGGILGLWAVSLTAIGFLAGQSWINALGPTVIRLALMSALGTLLGHSILITLMTLLGYNVDITRAMQTVIGPAALLNFILSPFIFSVLVWIHQRTQPRIGRFSD